MNLILEQISDAFFALDHQWRFTYMNVQAEHVLFRTREELLGVSVWEAFPEAVGSTFYEQYHFALAENETVTFEEYYAPLETWFEVRAYPTEEGLSVYFHNINQQKQAARELQKNREWIDRIVETNADGIVIIDLDGQIVFANNAAENILGLRRDLITNRHYNDPAWRITDIAGAPLPEEKLPFYQVLHTNSAVYNIEIAILHPDKTQVILSVNGAPVRDSDDTIEGVMLSFTNQTEYKRTEAAQQLLVQVGALLADLLDASEIVERVIQLIVPTFADWGMVHLLDDHTLSLISMAQAHYIPPAQRHYLEQEYPELKAPRQLLDLVMEGESIFISSHGEQQQNRPAEQSRVFCDQLECQALIMVPLIARDHTLGVFTLASSLETRPFTPTHLITTQELARRIALAIENAHLYQDVQNVLQSRDELFSMVTHDLKNPLGAIIGYTDLLERRFRRNETLTRDKVASIVENINKAADKMNRLLDELLDVALIRDQKQLFLRKEPTDLVELLDHVCATQALTTTTQHTIQFEAADQTVIGFYDTARIERVFENLLSNALKYSPDGGEINLTLQTDTEASATWAVIRVRDHGIGIPQRDLKNIFERFQRGSNVGQIKGNGIGLASARYIIEQHGGVLEVESTEGRGSLFTIRLPIDEPSEDYASLGSGLVQE